MADMRTFAEAGAKVGYQPEIASRILGCVPKISQSIVIEEASGTMTLEDWAYVAQIAGVIVVVVTLVYLSIQVRQGAQLLRSESRQVSLSTDQGGVYKFIEFPRLAKSFAIAETPTFEEKTQLTFWIIAQMRAREHEWLQYQSGALDGDTWLSYRDVIYFVLGTPRARALWELCRPYFNQSFVELVTEMISEAPHVDFWQKLEAVD